MIGGLIAPRAGFMRNVSWQTARLAILIGDDPLIFMSKSPNVICDLIFKKIEYVLRRTSLDRYWQIVPVQNSVDSIL